MYKNNKGVTMIALLVTIFVLGILASITFANLTNENGILNTSKQYKSSTEKSVIGNKINIMLLDYKMAKMDTQISIIDYFNSLKLKGEISSIINNNDGTYTITKDDVEVIVKEFEVVSIK